MCCVLIALLKNSEPKSSSSKLADVPLVEEKDDKPPQVADDFDDHRDDNETELKAKLLQ